MQKYHFNNCDRTYVLQIFRRILRKQVLTYKEKKETDYHTRLNIKYFL